MKGFIRTILVSCVLCLSSGLAFGAEPVKIGVMAPLTGSFASEGQDMRKLISLLAEEINKQGGINGAPIELIVEDDGSDPRTAANAANRLVSRGVSVVIGTYGSAVTAASQDIYDEAGVVQIATGSTAIVLSEKGFSKFFRTSPRDDEQARVAVAALASLGYVNIAILHDNSAYGKGLASEARDFIGKAGNLKVVFFDALQPKERDYTTILTKLKGVNPDVIFFTGYYPEAGILLRQMAEMKWSVPMLGGDAANNIDLVKIAGVEAAKGYRFVSPPMPSDLHSDSAKDFLSAYTAKYNEVPTSIWSVVAGDAFKVAVEAIKVKGTDAKAVADYLHNELKDFEGLTGKISFDQKGDRVGDVYRLYEVDAEGKFVLK